MNINWADISDFLGLKAAVGALIGGVGTWFFNKKKNRAEIETIEKTNIESDQKIIRGSTETYQMIIDDLHGRLKLYKEEVRAIEEEHLVANAKTRNKLRAYKEKIDELETEIILHKSWTCFRDNCPERKTENIFNN